MACVFCFLLLFSIGNCLAEEETRIDVTFNVLTGSGSDYYYVGDYFFYNITMKYMGSTALNATFRVEVFNPTEEIIGAVRTYSVSFQPNETLFLFPNITVHGIDEYNLYLFETPGTYGISLSSETPIVYYRYLANDAYTFDHNEIRFTFDAMPSYQKAQDERWQEFLQKNEEYMNEVNQYIQESRESAQYTRNLALVSINIAMFSILLSIGNVFFSWWKLSPEIQQEKRGFFRFLIILVVIVLALMLYQFLQIFGWI